MSQILAKFQMNWMNIIMMVKYRFLMQGPCESTLKKHDKLF